MDINTDDTFNYKIYPDIMEQYLTDIPKKDLPKPKPTRPSKPTKVRSKKKPLNSLDIEPGDQIIKDGIVGAVLDVVGDEIAVLLENNLFKILGKNEVKITIKSFYDWKKLLRRLEEE